jgi:hypothetical protein
VRDVQPYKKLLHILIPENIPNSNSVISILLILTFSSFFIDE